MQQLKEEKSVVEPEQSYPAVVKNSPLGVHLYELESDGRLTFRISNPAAQAMLAGRASGCSLGEIFPAVAQNGIYEQLRRTVATGEAWHCEHFEHGDAIYEVDAFRIETGWLALQFRDVTQTRRAWEALRAREARFAMIAENTGDMISTHNFEGLFTFVSPVCRTLLGYDPHELHLRNPFDIIHPDDAHLVAQAQSSIRRLGIGRTAAYRMLRKNGEPVWVESTNRAVPDPLTGELREIIVVTREITERRLLQEQICQAQKLESVGRLAAGVAHDFNNLLTIINGYSGILVSEMDRDDPHYESVSEIAAAGERGAALTQQLLAFSRKQVLQTQILEVNAVIRDAERMLRRVTREDIGLRLELDPAAGKVRADASQIQQVLLNLAINARDAMPHGGKLILETGSAELDEFYSSWHPEVSPGTYTMIAVSDTGSGMDAETRQHIFEPFFTTKEEGRGTGLGLATAFGIVKQSGGHISVYSEPDRGTTFRIYLPRLGESEMAVTTADPPPKPARGSETILLVEDEPEVRRFAFHVLTKYGYRTLDAAHADEALAVCERHPGPVHLLLTDIVLPGMNGCELAARLLRTRPQAKVLYISGYTDQAITAVAGVDPGLHFLAKPFTPDALATRVRQVLGERSVKPTILVVDDEASIRKLLHKILETAGYAVLEAANGREAIHRVRQRPVDVMLTDLIMPEKEGLETIRELRSQYPAVRVVAMSGAFDRRYLKTAAMMGAQATLKKPIAPDELLRVVDKLMLGKK